MTLVDGDLVSLGEVLDAADRLLAAGQRAAPNVTPTGFALLDTYLGGGLRAGELCLLGGPQGLGKTALALQIARNAASQGRAAIVLSYEHDTTTLLERLVAIEAAEQFGVDGLPLRRVRDALEGRGAPGSYGLEDRLAASPGGAEAVTALRAMGDRLLLHRSSGTQTGMDEVASVVRAAAVRMEQAPLVVVDYLQRVPAEGQLEDERIATVVAALKDLALAHDVPVLAIVAADKEGLAAGKRLRAQHLRGPTALAYEADVLLMMNEKYDVVARHHLVYDSRSIDRYRGHVVLTIEKNRSGLAKIDLQLRKRLEQSRFERDVEPVPEELMDERLHSE
jgi:replicative DNA helicase